jgi:phenylalanyl-tRNA synthetase beta chain
VLPLPWLERKLGRAISASEVRKILEALMFRVESIDQNTLSVHVPTWRATKDVSVKEDLVEEIGRMIGYASITPTAPITPATVPYDSGIRVFHRHVRDVAAAQGFTEVSNYSFLSVDDAQSFGFDPEQHVQVTNPIAADQNLLRTSLLPGLCRNITDNARHFDAFRLFEIGHEHHDGEWAHFAAAVFAKDDGAAGLLELKRLAECLLPACEVRPTADVRSFEHPQRSADITAHGKSIGRLFEFHPRLVEQGRAAVLDLDLLSLQKAQPTAIKYKPLRRFPSSDFDLSIVAAPRVLIGDIEASIRDLAGAPLLAVAFLREFPLKTGERSLSYRLTVGASDRTLSTEEVTAVRNAVIEGLRAAGFELKV